MRYSIWFGCLVWALAGCGEEGTDSTTDDANPTDVDDTPDTDTTADTDIGVPTDTDPLLHIDGLSWVLHAEVEAFAIVSWTQETEGEVHVEYSIDEGEWLSSPTILGQVGDNEQLIAGIPYGMSAEWRVVASEDDFVDASDPIITADPPDDLPIGRLSAANESAWLPEGNFLLTSISTKNGGWNTNGPFYAMIIDRRGRPVWAVRTGINEWTLYATVSVDGDHILYDQFSWIGNNARIYRSYLDEVIEEIDTPGFHHAFVELPDNTLAWASRSHGFGEALVEKAPGQADETIIWTCSQDWPEIGGCDSNCLFYNVPTDSYLYSFYSDEAVVEIDRSTGENLWWAGGVSGGYGFDPPESQFYWQHGVSYTDAGTLLVSTHNQGGWGATTNLAREYIVDDATETLIEIWNYNAEAYANTNGDTWRLSNGNTLHTLGSASEIKEVDADGITVWHMDYDSSKLLGRSEWIDDLYTLVKPLP